MRSRVHRRLLRDPNGTADDGFPVALLLRDSHEHYRKPTRLPTQKYLITLRQIHKLDTGSTHPRVEIFPGQIPNLRDYILDRVCLFSSRQGAEADRVIRRVGTYPGPRHIG
jgi:hypothetical protein